MAGVDSNDKILCILFFPGKENIACPTAMVVIGRGPYLR